MSFASVAKGLLATSVLAVSGVFLTTGPVAAATTINYTSAGDLVITGDNSDEYVELFTRSYGYEVRVESGATDKTYEVHGELRDVRLNMKGGNDSFRFYGEPIIGRNLTVNLGAGSFQSMGGDDLEVGGNLTFTDSIGRGVVDLSATEVGGNTVINLGGGPNALVLENVMVDGDFRVTDGSGSSELDFFVVVAEGKSTMSLGSGSDTVNSAHSIWYDDVTMTTSSSGKLDLDVTTNAYHGKFNLTTGNNADVLSFHNDTSFIQPATINSRGGNDHLQLGEFVHLRATMDIRMGGGNDYAHLYKTNVLEPLSFKGEGGEDIFNTTGSTYDATATLDGGSGTDQLTGIANVFNQAPTVTSFEVG